MAVPYSLQTPLSVQYPDADWRRISSLRIAGYHSAQGSPPSSHIAWAA